MTQHDSERGTSGHWPVCHDVALHCVDQDDRPLVFMATFSYEPSLPYAVDITCHLTEADLTWTIDRDLVAAGLTDRIGVGLVQFEPVPCEQGLPMVAIRLLSSAGCLRTSAERSAIQQFLEATWRAVPPGTESELVDLDALVADLLDS